MGRVGQLQPPRLPTLLSLNKSHRHWGQTIMGTRGDAEALPIFFVGGTGRGSSGGDTDGQGGGAMATKRSRLPVLDQKPLAPKTKIHGEPGRRESTANFFIKGTGRGFSEGDTGGT